MIGVSADYTNRKIDLEIFQTENPPALLKELKFSMTDGNVSRKLTGMQKLAQRYMITFFTAKGSVAFRPDYGSSFMPAINAGLLQSRTAVVQYFSFANIEVGQQLQLQDQLPEGVDMPADEKFARAYLMDYAVNTSEARLYLKVKLESMAGAAYTFVLPVT